MQELNPAYELYLYQLLKEQIGLNRQTSIDQIDRALEADGLVPADFDATDSRTLAEAVPHFIKLTVFKKGVIFVTLIENEAFERALSASEKGHEDSKTLPNGKPWKRRRGTKNLRPLKPPHKEETMTAHEKNDETNDITKAIPTPEVKDTFKPQSEKEPAAEIKSKSETDLTFGSEPETEADPTVEPKSTPAISLTITYDPSEAAPSSSVSSEQRAPLPYMLPHNFETDVHIDTDTLGTLYQMAPMDSNALKALTGDFLLAQSSDNLEVTDGNITFPLRYRLPHQLDAITATLKRTPGAQRPWKLISINNISLKELRNLAVDPFKGLPHTGINPWEKLPSKKGFPVLDPLELLMNERPIEDWKELIAEVSGHAALPDKTFSLQRLPLQQAVIATAYAYRRAHQQLIGTHEDFYLPVKHVPALENIYFDRSRPWISFPSFEQSAHEKKLDIEALIENARAAGASGYRTMAELYHPSLDVIYNALPIQTGTLSQDNDLSRRTLVFEASETPHDPYVAIALLDNQEAYALARLFSADLPSWLQ